MWLHDFLNLFFPNLCQACGNPLVKQENVICINCRFKLPATNFHYFEDNPISRIFWGRVNLTSATSFLFFNKGGIVQRLIHNFKYKGNKDIGYYFGELIAKDLVKSPLFSDINVVVPVPLHIKKVKTRGFNQSEVISVGISRALNITTNTTALIRSEFTETQTKKARYTRWENVRGKFCLNEPNKLEGMHILLVDDVLTTGATLEACAEVLLEIQNVKVSLVTLAYAQA